MLKKITCTMLTVCFFMSTFAQAQTNDFLSADFWKKATVVDVEAYSRAYI